MLAESKKITICCGSVVCDHQGNKHVVLDLDTGENTIEAMQILKRRGRTHFALSGGLPIDNI